MRIAHFIFLILLMTRNLSFLMELSFLQAIESPELARDYPVILRRIFIVNFFLSCVFFIELLLKIVVHGLIIQVRCSSDD